MSDSGRKVQDDKGAARPGTEGPERDGRNTRTAGTDRDYDESQESKNQGHGHSDEQRERSDQAGHSERTVTETDRADRDLGGPGG